MYGQYSRAGYNGAHTVYIWAWRVSFGRKIFGI